MSSKLPPEKVVKKFLLQLEFHLLAEYNKIEGRENPKNQEKQMEIVKKLILDYLKVSKNKQNQCKNNQNKQQCFDFIKIQENYIDQTEKINRLKKQMEIEFEMTKNFINVFKKENDNKKPQIHLENISLTESVTNYRKQKDFQIQLIKIQDSGEKFLRKTCTTDRLPKIKHLDELDEEIFIEDLNENNDKNKTLERLKKLQKFFCQKQNTGVSTRGSKVWGFSPPKAFYKQQNENLKILQENLRTQLQMIENQRSMNINEAILRKQQALKKKQVRLTNLQSQLFKKQMNLNKRHSEILRKQQILKRIQV